MPKETPRKDRTNKQSDNDRNPVSRIAHKEAIDRFDNSLESNLSSSAWDDKGDKLRHKGRYDEAIICYNNALKLNPSCAKTWNNKGNALYDQNKPEEAVKCYDKAIELDQKFALAWNNKGLALISMGIYEEAIASFENAIKIDSNLKAARTNLHKSLMKLYRDNNDVYGTTLIRQGNYNLALEYYDRISKLYPNDPAPLYGKARALNRLGKYEKALRFYNKILKLKKNHADALSDKKDLLSRHKDLLRQT